MNGMTRDNIEGVKGLLKDAMRKAHLQLQEKMASRLGAQAADVEDVLQKVFETACDLGGRDSELDKLRSSKAYVKPVRRYLGTCPNSKEDFYAYDAPLDLNLERTLFPQLWEEIKSSAAQMQHADPRTTTEYADDLQIADLWDGVEFQKFMCKVAIKPGEAPLVFMFYYDGLEVVNGMGQARSTHELGCFYWALLNLSQDKRLHRDFVRLATVCHERAIGVCGMDEVVSGKGGSWVEWMLKLDKGLMLKTPEGPLLFRGGTAIVAADTPAAGKLMGTKVSVGPSTKSICRNCHCHQAAGAHRKPHSFLPSQPGWKRYCPGRATEYRLRSADDLREYIAKLRAVKAGTVAYGDLENWMQEQGVNTFHGALWRLPHFCMQTGCPMDMMHIWLEGVGRQNLGALSYWLKKKCNANLYDIPQRMAKVAPTVGLRMNDFPRMNNARVNTLGEGATGGLPSTDCSFPGTAGQVAHVLLHLPAIFRDMVPAGKQKDPVWQMALLTCKISRLLWQRSFTTADILTLDRSIWLHDTAVLGSPFLQHLWKPKNHYLSHFPLEILLWGPPRTYWCMSFEHENQLLKHGAQGNFKDPVWDAAECKSLRVALTAEEDKQRLAELPTALSALCDSYGIASG